MSHSNHNELSKREAKKLDKEMDKEIDRAQKDAKKDGVQDDRAKHFKEADKEQREQEKAYIKETHEREKEIEKVEKEREKEVKKHDKEREKEDKEYRKKHHLPKKSAADNQSSGLAEHSASIAGVPHGGPGGAGTHAVPQYPSYNASGVTNAAVPKDASPPAVADATHNYSPDESYPMMTTGGVHNKNTLIKIAEPPINVPGSSQTGTNPPHCNDLKRDTRGIDDNTDYSIHHNDDHRRDGNTAYQTQVVAANTHTSATPLPVAAMPAVAVAPATTTAFIPTDTYVAESKSPYTGIEYKIPETPAHTVATPTRAIGSL